MKKSKSKTERFIDVKIYNKGFIFKFKENFYQYTDSS